MRRHLRSKCRRIIFSGNTSDADSICYKLDRIIILADQWHDICDMK
jgi:hypothetical protein